MPHTLIRIGNLYIKSSSNYDLTVFGLVMKGLFSMIVFIKIFTAVISRILSMLLKFLSTRIFDFEWF